MDCPEQVVELARRRHPEEAFHRLVRLVENAVGQAHRHADQVARGGNDIFSVEHEIETPFEHIDEFVLRRVDVRRHESAGRKRGVPGKRTLAHRLRHVSLTENIPDNTVKPGPGFGYSRCEFLHRIISFANRDQAALRRPLAAIASSTRSVMVSASAGLRRDCSTASAKSVMALASRAAFQALSAASTSGRRRNGSGGETASNENARPCSIAMRHLCSWASCRCALNRIEPALVPAVRALPSWISSSLGRPAKAASTISSTASADA